MDPGTAMLIATAVGTGAKAGSDYFGAKKAKKSGKMRALELKRETLSDLLNQALQGSAELEGHGLKTRSQLARRKGQSMQETADLVRGAFNI